MIRFYFDPTPNPAKVALLLEETGLPYEVVPVGTSKGEQPTPGFRAINPNGKVPAVVDTEGPGGKEVRVFNSTAILLYLAEKTRQGFEAVRSCLRIPPPPRFRQPPRYYGTVPSRRWHETIVLRFRRPKPTGIETPCLFTRETFSKGRPLRAGSAG